MNRLLTTHHLGSGTVFHGRRVPKPHQFTMSVYMVWVCLGLSRDKLSSQLSLGPLSRFEPKDYWKQKAQSAQELQNDIINEWAQRGLAIDNVCLLSNPRSLNTKMNPLSVFYCYRDGELVAFIAEVTNTPWGERHHYFLAIGDGEELASVDCTAHAEWADQQQGKQVTFTFHKDMHVSPFNPISMNYEMRFYTTPDKISVVMHLSKEQQPIFDASLHLKTQPLTRTAWLKSFWRKPWMTMQVRLRIYFEALRLALKGVPFYKHPNKQ